MDQKELSKVPETKKYLESIFLASDIDYVLSFFVGLAANSKGTSAVFEFPIVFNTHILVRTFSSYITALNDFERPLTVFPYKNCLFVWPDERTEITSLVFQMQEPIQNDTNSQLIVLEIPTFKKLLTA